jgi:hypothetical protein
MRCHFMPRLFPMTLGWLIVLGLMSPFSGLHAADHPVKLRLEDDQHQPVAGVKVWVVTTKIGGQGEPDELSQGISGPDGRVTVTIADRWLATPLPTRQEVALIAYKPGYCVTSVAIWRDSPLRNNELILTLPTSVTTSIQVLSPDNQPVVKGKVEIGALAVDVLHSNLDKQTAAENAASRGYSMRQFTWGYTLSQTPITLPVELQKSFTFQLDAQGTVKCVDLDARSISIVTVDSTEHGKQLQFRNLFLNDAQKPRDVSWPGHIRLARTGQVSAELIAPFEGALKNRLFTLSTRPPNQAFSTQDLIVMGVAEVQPNAEGKLVVPAMVPGQLQWQLKPVSDETLVVDGAPFLGGPQVIAGKTTNTKIRALRGTQISGTVVDSVTEKPIPNATVFVLFNFTSKQTSTDQHGHYQTLVPPGQISVQVGPPEGYFPNSTEQLAKSSVFAIPADKTDFSIPPIKLDPAVTCSGIVIDETGKAVSGATIHVLWMGRSRASETSSRNHLTVKTNEKGEFQVQDVNPGQCLVWCEFNGAYSERVSTMTPKDLQGMKLSISPKHTVTFVGKLTDSEGHPVSRATLELTSREPTFGDITQPESKVTSTTNQLELRVFDSENKAGSEVDKLAPAARRESITIQADGSFQLPPLPPHNEYLLVIKSPRTLPRTLPWNRPERAGMTDLGNINLQVVGDLTGTLVDHHGKPVANATVTSITATERRVSTATERGNFRFDSTTKDGFLIVEHPDFRCFGLSTDDLKEGKRLALTRKTEPPLEPFRPRPTEVTPEIQRQLAEQLLRPILDIKSKATDNDRIRALQAKASWDPLSALELLEDSSFKKNELAGMVRRTIVAALAKDNLDAALEITESDQDESSSAGLLRVLFLRGNIPAEKKKQMLADAYVRVKAMKQPELRICFQGFLAEHLWDMGERVRAEELLREGLELAKKLPTSEFGGYARGAFAEELSVLDLPAALALIKELKDNSEFDRHHGNIAHELANRNPAEAQRVLGMIKPVDPNGNRFDGKSFASIPVCYRMASMDLPRAIEIAKSLDDRCAQARCFAVMAEALLPTDRAAATQMIENAFQSLQQQVGKQQIGQRQAGQKRGRLTSPFTVGETAGSLLTTIEKIDPQRIPESIWRCFALLEPISPDPQYASWDSQEKMRLSMFVALYDVSIARTLLHWIQESAPTTPSSRAYLPTLAVVDPEAAVALVEKMPDFKQSIHDRLTLAKILAHQGEERIRILRRNASFWNIDAEDIDAD